MHLNCGKVNKKSDGECYATLEDDVLCIGNALIERRFAWNGGNLIGRSIEDRRTRQVWQLIGETPDITLPGESTTATNGRVDIHFVPEAPFISAHLRADIEWELGSLTLRRQFHIYAGAPAIASDLLIKGRSTSTWQSHTRPTSQLTAIESAAAAKEGQRLAPVIERLVTAIPHLRQTAVQFFDVTDRNNNLVAERSVLPYRQPIELTGSLLLTQDLLQPRGLFVLKEAPCSDVQLAWPGADFICRGGEVSVVGLGIDPGDLQENEWTPCYGCVVGVAGEGIDSHLLALRTYQHQSRQRKSERDDTIVLNTWGDRSRDARLSERFVIDEIHSAAALGVTHLQLDDGWQSGRSGNSAFEGGTFSDIWNRTDYWSVHRDKFPNGLAPVLEAAKAAGVQIGLWYNPSNDNHFGHWMRDAEQIIQLHQLHGVNLFKIDGVDIAAKRSEQNLKRMLDEVMSATQGRVSFNLDVTAGRRFGYHFFNEYGNKFLENRYTDFGNYYPHWTLRNLWQLSHYVPPQLLQVEFLNIWRNADKYPANDPLSPLLVGFDYSFAVTMMAQPLAWFEASGLPPEAQSVAPLIAAYRNVQSSLHEGMILPFGEEPCGTAWTGFQSIQPGGGFVAVYRELNDNPTRTLVLPGQLTGRIRFQHVLGNGADFTAEVGSDRKVQFEFSDPMSFALYKIEAAARS